MPFRGSPRPALRSWTVTLLLTALIALGQISTSLYIPSLPSLPAALGATTQQANQTLALFLLGFAPAQLLLGPLSDHYGRRPVAAMGLGLFTIASVGCALAPSIEVLLLGRFIQGMTACTGPVLSRAIVRDVYGPEDSAKAMAYIGAALAISPAVAPVIGGYLQVWFGWRASFVLLAAIGAGLLMATQRLLQETRPASTARSLSAQTVQIAYLQVVKVRRYWAWTLTVAFTFAALMTYTAGSPFVLIDLIGLSPQHYGMLSVVTVAGYLAGSVAAGRLSGRWSSPRLTSVGLLLSVLGGVALSSLAAANVLSVPAIVLPMAVITTGMGLIFALGIAGAMAPFRETAGAASALLGFVQMAVAAGVTTVLGLFPHTSARPMAFAILICVSGAAVAYGLLARR